MVTKIRLFMAVKGSGKNIIGQQFNWWTVIDNAEPTIRKHGNRQKVLCKCDCGNIRILHKEAVMNGHTKSCGCKKAEMLSKANSIHGLSKHPLGQVRGNMIRRCYTPTHIDYHNYGGRGIRVYDEWRTNPVSFYDWAIQNGWRESLEIDRIDVNGNYEPGNCRFVTREVNANNKRNSHFVTYKGKTQTIGQWSRELNLSYRMLRKRVVNNRGPVELAFEVKGRWEYRRKCKELNPNLHL